MTKNTPPEKENKMSSIPFDECFFCGCFITNEYVKKSGDYGQYMGINTRLSGTRQYNCKACGKYSLTGGEYIDSIARDTDMLSRIRHFLAVHKTQSENDSSNEEFIEFTDDLLSSIMKRPLLTPPEQRDNMIRFLANSIMARDYQQIKYRIHGGLIGSNSYIQFEHVYRDLVDKKVIHELWNSKFRDKVSYSWDSVLGSASLTVDGWRYYQQLKKGGASNNKGFMALCFNNDELSDILDNHFKPAAKLAGFELFTLRDEHRAGLIDNQMFVAIQNSDFIVADLTDGNQGAYFEAGYAMGLDKPVIFTCEKAVWEDVKTHFDVNHYRTIIWESNALEVAANKLKFTIRATLPDKAKMSDDKE